MRVSVVVVPCVDVYVATTNGSEPGVVAAGSSRERHREDVR